MSGMSNPTDVSQKKNDHRGVIFIAEVMENEDPKKLKRVRIKIDEVIEGSSEELPWAIPIYDDFEHCKIPEKGTFIYVTLQNGDRHYPVYSGTTTSVAQLLPGILQTNYPNRYGMQDSKGNYFFVDKTSGDVEFLHHSGTKINIDDSGKAVVNVAADLELHVSGSITSDASSWAHTGDIAVTGNMDVTGIVAAADFSTPTLPHYTNHRHDDVLAGVPGNPPMPGF